MPPRGPTPHAVTKAVSLYASHTVFNKQSDTMGAAAFEIPVTTLKPSTAPAAGNAAQTGQRKAERTIYVWEIACQRLVAAFEAKWIIHREEQPNDHA